MRGCRPPQSFRFKFLSAVAANDLRTLRNLLRFHRFIALHAKAIWRQERLWSAQVIGPEPRCRRRAGMRKGVRIQLAFHGNVMAGMPWRTAAARRREVSA